VTEDQMPFESELVTRIGWLIRLRWIAVGGTAVVIGAAAVWLPGQLQLRSLLAVTVAIAIYNVLLVLNLRSVRLSQAGTERFRQATVLASIQIVLDLLALAILVHFSGGVENPMVLFFIFHVIIACILLRRSLSFAMTGLAILLVSGLAALEYAGLVPHYHLAVVAGEMNGDPIYLLAYAMTIALTLVIVAFLVTTIAARLRERDEMLLESNASCRLRSDELAGLNAALQRVDAERTRFVVLVTHELRAPIATIHSALELVRGGYTTPAETEDMLDRAQRRASELLDLIRDLLDLSRIRESAQGGKPERAIAPLQLANVLHEVVEFVEPEVARHNLTLETEVAADLAEVRIPADQAKLVWTNLLSNAIKYNRPGGLVRVVLSQDAGHLLGSVSDTGIGIAADDLPHVFEEFFRASNAKLVSAHGSGVGMATVRRVVENWGGEVAVESELGKGTTFRFSLPRA
jgi:signal transduction histidine kinase